jgi:hypothetical protein
MRFFKIQGDDEEYYGRFSGIGPDSAAKKAFCSLCKNNIKGKIKFSIEECTSNGDNQVYNYIGERVKLATPNAIEIGKGGDKKVLRYAFVNKVRKVKKNRKWLHKIIKKFEFSIL